MLWCVVCVLLTSDNSFSSLCVLCFVLFGFGFIGFWKFCGFLFWYWKFGKVLDLVSQKCVGAKVCLQSETKLEEMVGDIYIVVGRVSVWLMYGSFIRGGIGWFVWLVIFDSIADLK